jgi:hypothetical protein
VPFTQYQGYDVLEVEPSFDQPATEYVRNLKVLDSMAGQIGVTDRAGVPVTQPKAFRWFMQSRADVDLFRQFIAARKGACVPFWVPTWRNNFPLTADIVSGTASMTIPLIQYTSRMFPINANHHIAFILAQNRTMYYRKVTAAVASSSTETLTLDSNLPATIPSQQGGALVCKLQLCRLAFDDPELLWWTVNGIAESILEFVELPFEVPA